MKSEPAGASTAPMVRQLKDAVYQRLRDEILDGTLAPGYQLREAELAKRFSVSKTPLRDALVRLETEGLVVIPPYRTAVVVGYSREDLREIYEVRELLEGACAREAALRIGADDLAALSLVVRDSAACVVDGEVAPGKEADLAGLLDQFDQLIYAQSRNSRLDEMVQRIRNHIYRIGRLTTGIPGRLAKSVPQHQEIYEAIVRRDGAAAEAAMRQHILSVMADHLIVIGDSPDQKGTPS